MDALLENFFNIVVFREVLPFLLQGLLTTLGLSALVIPTGLAGGLAVALLATQTRNRAVKVLVAAYVDVFRALPPIVMSMTPSGMTYPLPPKTSWLVRVCDWPAMVTLTTGVVPAAPTAP